MPLIERQERRCRAQITAFGDRSASTENNESSNTAIWRHVEVPIFGNVMRGRGMCLREMAELGNRLKNVRFG